MYEKLYILIKITVNVFKSAKMEIATACQTYDYSYSIL